MNVEGFNLEDSSCVVVQSAGQREVQLQFIVQRTLGCVEGTDGVEDEAHLLNALHACLRVTEHLCYGIKLLRVAALKLDDGLQFLYGLLRDAVLAQFFVDGLKAYLVKLVDGNGDIHYLVGLANGLCYAGKNLAVVDFYLNPYAEPGEDGVGNLHEIHLVEQRVRAHHIDVTLVELPVATLLRTVGTPYGLYLIALEGQLKLFAVLHHIACERHGEVVAQTFLAELRRKLQRRGVGHLVGGHTVKEIARVEYLKQQLVALLAVLTHQRGEVLHCRRLYLTKTVELEHPADSIEDIVSLCHLKGSEVTGALWYTWFAHIQIKNDLKEIGGGIERNWKTPRSA